MACSISNCHTNPSGAKARIQHFQYVAVETATHKDGYEDDVPFLNILHILYFLYFPNFLYFLLFVTGTGPKSSIMATTISLIVLFAACTRRLLSFPRIEKIKCAPPTVVA